MGGDTPLAALAAARDVRRGYQLDVGDRQARELGQAQPGVCGEGEQGSVTAAGPGAGGDGVEEGLGFGVGQPGQVGAGVFLDRDGGDPGEVGEVLGQRPGGVGGPGMDRGQAGVAGSGAVAAAGFQPGQEPGDLVVVDLLDGDPACRGAGVVADVLQEEFPGVAVGADGVRAQSALGHQMVGEERLDCRGDRGHGRHPWSGSSRAAARARSRGEASRYQ
jgi:hypothetical protein